MKEAVTIFNIAEKKNKVHLMKKAIQTLSKNPDMGFVVAHLTSSFIDELVSATSGKTKEPYMKYLKDNFPDLCESLDAEMFYKYLRCKAIHEFALKPPLALAHSDEFDDENSFTEKKEIDGEEWIFLNVDRLVKDFLAHLDTL
jgi:hypothetical protein